MASNLHLLGRNIEVLVNYNKVPMSRLIEATELSEADIHRVYEGRLLLTPQQLRVFAEIFKVDFEFLISEHTDRPYGFPYPCGFSNQNNEDKILNIIDDYIDLVESCKQ